MYLCNIIRVVDGDTLILDINLGIPFSGLDGLLVMNLWAKDGSLWLIRERVRLVKINAPEMKTDEGPLAREYLIKLSQGGPFTLRLKGKDKYGRCLGEVFNANGESLNAMMLAALMARDYM